MNHALARPCAATALAAAGLLLAGAAAAAEPYVATGFPYLLVGFAQPINPSLAVRADFGSIAHHSYSGSTSDNDFKGSIKYSRFALLADWFVADGGFRLSGGATFDQAKATMTASSHSGKITLGGVQYDAPSSLYYVQSDLSFPKAMPYLGLGWGHHQSAPGLSFNFDLGAVKRSCIHFVTPNEQIIPFETYNLFYRNGQIGPIREGGEEDGFAGLGGEELAGEVGCEGGEADHLGHGGGGCPLHAHPRFAGTIRRGIHDSGRPGHCAGA